METTEPCFDVAQLAHVELLTPRPDESLWFFRDILGMQVSAQEGQSVYLRGFEEYCHHSLKLTEAPEAGMGHCAWRTSSAPALQRRADAIDASGFGDGWIDGDVGHGRAYTFHTPDGHKMELVWDVDRAVVPTELTTRLQNRPQRRPLTAAPVRRIDHVNVMCRDLDSVAEVGKFMRDTMGFRLREVFLGPDGKGIRGEWLSVSALVHEIAIMGDGLGASGRLHHLCFWYGTQQHLEDLVDVCNDHRIFVELGPAVHGITRAKCLYVREPGGNRIELFGDTGYLILDPDWEAPVWSDDDLEIAGAWVGTPEFTPDWFMYGTPVLDPASISTPTEQDSPTHA